MWGMRSELVEYNGSRASEVEDGENQASRVDRIVGTSRTWVELEGRKSKVGSRESDDG